MSQKDDIVQCLQSGIEKPVLIIDNANLPADNKVVERWRHHGGHEKNLTRVSSHQGPTPMVGMIRIGHFLMTGAASCRISRSMS